MAQEFGKLLRLEWGQDSFPIESCKPKHRWARDENGSRQGYLETYEVIGEVTGDNHAQVIAAREALRTAISRDSQVMRVVALDSAVIHFLDPAVIALQGGSGPYLADFDFDDTGPRNCRFKLTIAAQLKYPGGVNLPPAPVAEQEIIRTERDVNGREGVRRSGRIQGDGAYAVVLTRIPAGTPTMQVTFSAQRNEGDSDVRYEIGLIPLAGALPASNVSDGEMVVRTQEDRLSRTRVVSGYFVGSGALAASNDARDSASQQRHPVRSQLAESKIQTGRLDFSHEFVEALRSDDVVGWQESVKAGYTGFEIDIARYPGTRPLFIVDDMPPRHVEHSGTITRRNGFYDPPPAPLFPLAWLDGPGEVSFVIDESSGDYVTSFRYSGSSLSEYAYGANGPLYLPPGAR